MTSARQYIVSTDMAQVSFLNCCIAIVLICPLAISLKVMTENMRMEVLPHPLILTFYASFFFVRCLSRLNVDEAYN